LPERIGAGKKTRPWSASCW